MLIGLDEALRLTLENITPLPTIQVDLMEGLHHALARDVGAQVDSPSVDASLKDGYAVMSGDVVDARPERPVRLHVIGNIAAGGSRRITVTPGTAVRVLTGAGIPPGATAVVSEEYTAVDGDSLMVSIDAEPGRNILPRGSDVAAGQVVAEKGSLLSPGLIGLLAAAGHSRSRSTTTPSTAAPEADFSSPRQPRSSPSCPWRLPG